MARPELTGVLLLGGASRRFGSPKALAQLDGETLAERAWRVLGEACEERLAFGKTADGLDLPFPLLDDGTKVRHPAAGLVAGLRAARNDVVVFLPVDCPEIEAEELGALGRACADAAVPAVGKPVPGAFRKSALPALERCLERRDSVRSALAELDVRTVELDPTHLADTDTALELLRVERRRRAFDAALAVAAAQGLDASAARVLADWNDTVIHLAPSPVVARVRTSWVEGEDAGAIYERELAVARHAAARGGPIVQPAENPGPFRANGLVVALWEYVAPLARELSDDELGAALAALHKALDAYEGELPSLDERLDRAEAVVADPQAVASLAEDDRLLLQSAFRELRTQAATRQAQQRALHGGPHRANLLATEAGPRWIDFDTVCAGPLEWDLSHLPAGATDMFPGHDPELLPVMRALVSAEVAIWCWHTYGRAPEVDEAAHFHLEQVRAQ